MCLYYMTDTSDDVVVVLTMCVASGNSFGKVQRARSRCEDRFDHEFRATVTKVIAHPSIQ